MSKEKSYFNALYEVAMMVNASLDMAKVLDEIVAAVVKTMGVKASSIRLLDTHRKRLVMGAAAGLSDNYLKKGPVTVDDSGLDQKAIKGEVIIVNDAQSDPDFQYQDWAKKEGFKSVMVVPLKARSETIGVLRVYAEDRREFGDEEKLFMKAVANISALALDNARLHQALKADYELLVAHKYRVDDN